MQNLVLFLSQRLSLPKKVCRWLIQLGLVLSLVISGQSLLLAGPPISGNPPPPSDNTTVAGGGLSPACGTGEQRLTALVPVQNYVDTISERPTFLFYVPYQSEQIRYGEFSVSLGKPKYNQAGEFIGWDEPERFHQSQFTLPQTPGIVSISLPPDKQLAENSNYHWYFDLRCQSDTPLADADWQSVDGWVRRLPATAEREKQVNAATLEIWYDALALLAAQRRANPNDPVILERWQNLLGLINQGGLASQPLLDSVLPYHPS